MSSILIALVLGVVALVGTAVAKNTSHEKVETLPVVSNTATSSEGAPKAADSALPDSDYRHGRITIGNESFDALVSDTEPKRETGLSYRNGLKKGEVMLFIFDKPDLQGFWMKDMRFSLDMLWLDSNLRVVSFQSNVSPETYPNVFYPTEPSLYVVELSAGTLDNLHVKVGDKVALALPDAKTSGGK